MSGKRKGNGKARARSGRPNARVARPAAAADAGALDTPAPAPAADPVTGKRAAAFKVGERVKVLRGEYASTRGNVEEIDGGDVTLRVHARLAVSVAAADLERWPHANT